MSVAIRLARHGAKKRPYYRVVVTDSRSARDGRYIEQIGTYDPLQPEARIDVKADRLEQWLSRGARPSDTVKSLLKRAAAGGGEAPAAEPAEAGT